MMDFNSLFLEYKQFIEENSIYSPRVVKDFTYKSTYFPIVDFKRNESVNSQNMTVDRIEYYDNEDFEINIYAQDKGNISRNVIIDELTNLTHVFMGIHKNMNRTSCRNLPNLDTDVGRRMTKYQCRWGNIYGNIWRR